MPASRTARIVGGIEAEPDAWPWMAAVYDGYGFLCGGSLIHPEWVLTAGHCAYRMGAEEFDIVLGAHDLSKNQGEHFSVDAVFVHPDYNDRTLDADIALLHLSAPAGMESIRVVAQDDPVGLSAAGMSATVTGWGTIRYRGPDSDVLLQVSLPVVSREEAEAVFPGEITENMIAAGYKEGGKDSCQGDSGGPFMASADASTDGGSWTQIGIVSWGEGCAWEGYYGIYTRVSIFSDWIHNQMDMYYSPALEDVIWILRAMTGMENTTPYKGPDLLWDRVIGIKEALFIIQKIGQNIGQN